MQGEGWSEMDRVRDWVEDWWRWIVGIGLLVVAVGPAWLPAATLLGVVLIAWLALIASILVGSAAVAFARRVRRQPPARVSDRR